MRIVVAGAGGHARSIIDAIRTSAEPLDAVACTDPDPKLAGETVDGVPIVGRDQELERLIAEGIRAASVGVGGTGDNSPRARVHDLLLKLGFELPPIVHGRAYVSPAATLEPASVVLAGAIVGPGAHIGRNVIVNSGAIVEHDCSIADHVHLASGSVLGGGVVVESHAHVGLGARVLPRQRVGTQAIVGAGAVVVSDVGPGKVVVGCPAAPVRTVR